MSSPPRPQSIILCATLAICLLTTGATFPVAAGDTLVNATHSSEDSLIDLPSISNQPDEDDTPTHTFNDETPTPTTKPSSPTQSTPSGHTAQQPPSTASPTPSSNGTPTSSSETHTTSTTPTATPTPTLSTTTINISTVHTDLHPTTTLSSLLEPPTPNDSIEPPSQTTNPDTNLNRTEPPTPTSTSTRSVPHRLSTYSRNISPRTQSPHQTTVIPHTNLTASNLTTDEPSNVSKDPDMRSPSTLGIDPTYLPEDQVSSTLSEFHENSTHTLPIVTDSNLSHVPAPVGPPLANSTTDNARAPIPSTPSPASNITSHESSHLQPATSPLLPAITVDSDTSLLTPSVAIHASSLTTVELDTSQVENALSLTSISSLVSVQPISVDGITTVLPAQHVIQGLAVDEESHLSDSAIVHPQSVPQNTTTGHMPTNPNATATTDADSSPSWQLTVPVDPVPTGLIILFGGIVTAFKFGGTIASVIPATAVSLPQLLQHAMRAWIYRILMVAGYSYREFPDPLENDNRATIYETIKSTPGINLTSLVEETNLPESTIRYHLRILETTDLIEAAKIRGCRRYIPQTVDHIEISAALEEETTSLVLSTLYRHEPANGHDLAEALNRDPSTISYHLDRLADAGLVEREQHGPAIHNSLTPAIRDALANTTIEPPSPPGTLSD